MARKIFRFEKNAIKYFIIAEKSYLLETYSCWVGVIFGITECSTTDILDFSNCEY